MSIHFPQLAMAKFSDLYANQNLMSLHNTNPEPYTKIELEHTLEISFNEMLKEVKLGFTPDQGTNDLRQTLADSLYTSIKEKEIVTHAGAQEALFCCFHALLEPKDSVLVVTPVFEPLMKIPESIGCKIYQTQLDSNNNWSLNLVEIENFFKKGCKLFVINFPHNPTGVTISKRELLALVALCEKYNVWLLSDEVFKGLEHNKKYQLPAVADIYKKGISVGVISKAYAIPGLRVGWLVAKSSKLITKIVQIKGYLSICNSQIDEKITHYVIKKHEKILTRNLKIIKDNKAFLKNIERINGHDVDIYIPNAACSVFALFKSEKIDAENQAREIAKKSRYLLYPATLFMSKKRALRIGYGSLKFIKNIKEIL